MEVEKKGTLMTTRRTFLGTALGGVAVGVGAVAGLLGKRAEAKESSRPGSITWLKWSDAPNGGWMLRLYPSGVIQVSAPASRDASGYYQHVGDRWVKIAATDNWAAVLYDTGGGQGIPKPPPTYSPLIDELKPLLDRGVSVEDLAANIRNLSARWVF